MWRVYAECMMGVENWGAGEYGAEGTISGNVDRVIVLVYSILD